MRSYRMNEIVQMIRKNGSAAIQLSGEELKIGFQGQGQPGALTMLGGGYYTVRMADGRTFEIAKGQLVPVLPYA